MVNRKQIRECVAWALDIHSKKANNKGVDQSAQMRLCCSQTPMTVRTQVFLSQEALLILNNKHFTSN